MSRPLRSTANDLFYEEYVNRRDQERNNRSQVLASLIPRTPVQRTVRDSSSNRAYSPKPNPTASAVRLPNYADRGPYSSGSRRPLRRSGSESRLLESRASDTYEM